MNATTLLRAGFNFAHQVLESVMRDVQPDTLHRRVPGSTLGSPAAIYAHALFDEDRLVQGTVQGKPTVHASGGWADATGVAQPDTALQTLAWGETVRIRDMAAFRSYARAVYAATDEYLAGLSDADLDRTIDAGQLGQIPLGEYLQRFGLWHLTSHQGEISAVIGAMGQKGLKF